MRDDALHESSQPPRAARGTPSGRRRGALRPARDGRSGRARTSPAHAPPAPLRPPGGGAAGRRRVGRAGRERCTAAGLEDTEPTPGADRQNPTDPHATSRQGPQGPAERAAGRQNPQDSAEVRGTAGAPAGLRGRGADRARPARAAAERLRGGRRGGRAPRRDGPGRPLRRGSFSQGHAPAACGELTEPPTPLSRPGGICILPARRTSAAPVAEGGGPIADRARSAGANRPLRP